MKILTAPEKINNWLFKQDIIFRKSKMENLLSNEMYKTSMSFHSALAGCRSDD